MPHTAFHSLSPWSRRLVRGALLLLAAAAVAGGIFVLVTVKPTDASFYPKCQLHSLTGLHCPGCGTTRAVHALLNGRLEQALAHNPLALIILPVLGYHLFFSLHSWWTGRPRPPSPRWMRIGHKVLVVLLLLFLVLRNIPVYPLTLLAPHEI